jgi:hypothetical protein
MGVSDMTTPNHPPTTVAEIRELLDPRTIMTKLVSEAFRCGDLRACDAAQRATAEAFAERRRDADQLPDARSNHPPAYGG